MDSPTHRLGDAWEAEAEHWVAWARTPGHDSYWRFHRDRFLTLLPPSSGMTLDLGCGEGRLPRDLKARGYDVLGCDVSETLIRYALEADPAGEYLVADSAALPFGDGSMHLVTAFLSLHDMDNLDAALAEVARVLAPDGRLCAAIVHPINSAGTFQSRTSDAPFVISDSYFEVRQYRDVVERDELRMTFASMHRPLQNYVDALGAARFVIERLVEVPDDTHPPGDRWQRIPLFLHFRAIKS
jgi:SAM-dependent methyltransferase